MNSRNFARLVSTFAILIIALMTQSAKALPSFARQTNLDCSSCHLSWPELTSTGRQFKLSGYTWGERQLLPFTGMLEASRTSTKKVNPATPDEFAKDGKVILQEATVFAAGKISDHVGFFTEWAYDAIEHHSSVDVVDIRYANRIGERRQGLLYGLSLHNKPALQDIYNTGLAWGFPFASSAVAVAPNAELAIDGLGEQVAGLAAYALWRDTLYGEIATYRTADKAFSALRAGTSRADDAALKGYNPYWRLALQHEWDGSHSAMVGSFGMKIARYPDNTDPTGPTNRFTDLGVDAQYQYLDPNDTHRLSGQIAYVREKQEWNATAKSNLSDTLKSLRGKVTYYYQKKYGLSLGYFDVRGTADNALYQSGDAVTGSSGGSPNSSGFVAEFNYLPLRDIRIVLQYTGYSKFNGAKTNYDGFGRNAKDNNTLFLLGWVLF